MKWPRLGSFRLRAVWVVLAIVLLPQAIFALLSPLTDAALRREIGRLTLGMIPVGLLVGAWLGWRLVRPIEQLRNEVLDRARGKTTRVDLTLPRADEVGDLSAAFSALVGTLEERRAANEAFVSDLVHELKSPVAAIRASADALAQGPADEARAARIGAVLRDSSQRLDTIVTELLELARAEAGLPREARENVDLAKLAKGIAEALAASERFVGVDWHVAISGDVTVHGVPLGLETVLRNLLENAASFAGSEGHVALSVRPEADVVRTEIRDDGPGIPEAELARVFDRFFTTRGRERGTGLGLSLVRAIVEAHGGTVEALSGPSRGATFVVKLPRS